MRLLTPILLKDKPKLWSHEWFLAWQPLLLIAVNSPFGLGRDVRLKLGINLDIQIPIDRLMRNSFRIKIGFNEYQETFYGKPVFAIALKREWNWLWNLIHKWDMNFANNLIPRLNLGFDTLTKYPDAHPESTTIDGYVMRGDVVEFLSTIINGDGTWQQSNATTNSNSPSISCDSTGTAFSACRRWIELFDTSSIGSGHIVIDCILSHYGYGKYNGLGNPDLHIVSSNPASNVDLIFADYTSLGNISFGSIVYADWATTGYNDITLNANGRSNISLTEISKFGLKLSWDINNNFNGNMVAYVNSTFNFYSADNGTNMPKLVVTYSLPTNIGNQDVQQTMTQIRM